MKKIIQLSIIICICATTMLQSCALVFQGTKKNVYVKSTTPDAKIYVDGELKGTDAVNINLRRGDDHIIMIKKEGCQTSTTMITSHVQPGWVIFDAFFNWLAFLTDPTTGAWNTFDKSKVVVELDCK